MLKLECCGFWEVVEIEELSCNFMKMSFLFSLVFVFFEYMKIVNKGKSEF